MNEKINICFVANYSKTYLFIEIAKELIKEGYNIFWIVNTGKLYSLIRSSLGSNKEDILILNKEIAKKNVEDFYEIQSNELIYGDRSLKYYRDDWVQKYIRNIPGLSIKFIKENRIKYVVGELTYPHEIILSRLAPENEYVYLNPHPIRIPSGYFAFFHDEFQLKMAKRSSPLNTVPKIKLEKPFYFYINESLIKEKMSFGGRIKRLKRFFTAENIEKDDPYMISKFSVRLKKGIKEEFNSFAYNLIKKRKIHDIKGKKLALYALQKQPEASVDVVGRYYENQFINIINIWRILPFDWILCVKEHTNAIGDRSYNFFKKITSYKNIVLIDEKEDSHKLIELCDAIFTVSGTIAYEAAIKGKMAFTFVPTFFNKLKGCCRVTLDDLRNLHNIYELMEKNKEEDNHKFDLNEFEIFLSNYIYPGHVGDPLSYGKCLEKENIERIKNALSDVILSK